ncbi:hypothetical protein PISMIDRAFT_186639 [Pisolithus microcarpus 441]|uniref:Unplaced genomic scaffold scaffold_12, whole genome shotgun sequence n=1 Tax=Pisolithus microcarpus 441 TaxID=765257 RepID=A0A0C9ZNI9_9AGAM|nr:hypothetical protein BKA83DRAFT_186639 [Pisolithus microcarpus]KIK27489.1 hypothetical protein PISMIDRAFT_186639 [Pisolithus microcarpus 441]
MSPSPVAPWPAQTPPPSSYLRSSREPSPQGLAPPPLPRQDGTTISDSTAVDEAKVNCQLYANNNNVTCFPPAGEEVYQHQWAAVVWNSRRPQLTQNNLVNLYLFNADTQEALFTITDVQNPTGTAGEYNVLVNDSWFGTGGATWQPGQNLSYPFFWIVTNQDGLDGSQTTNPTFFAVQTTYADSVVSTMLSSSASLSSVSVQSSLSVHSSLSTASTASAASTASLASGTVAGVSSSVQPQQDDSVFPHWAIAVIVVLGFLAIVAGGILVWLILRRIRKRELQSNRGSMGSASPMMADAHHQQSPNLPLLVGVGGTGALGRTSSEHHQPPSVVSPDGVSEAHSAGDSGPFSGADAAIMANAFRQALRKPDFAAAPVEENDDGKDDVINRELAEEGRDIRSVGSSRGVRVETLSETGDRAQDH